VVGYSLPQRGFRYDHGLDHHSRKVRLFFPRLFFDLSRADTSLIRTRLWPEWNAHLAFLSDFGRAMNLDSLRSSHPIEVVLEDANKIAELVFPSLSLRSARLTSIFFASTESLMTSHISKEAPFFE